MAGNSYGPADAEARKRNDEMLTDQEQDARSAADGTEKTGQKKVPAVKKASAAVKKADPAAKKVAPAAKSAAAKKQSVKKAPTQKASSQKTASPDMPRKEDIPPVNAAAEESPVPENPDSRGEQVTEPGLPHLPESPVLQDSLGHGRHVAVLAAALFDQLAELHSLDDVWRKRLVLAARLHDIGFVEGRKGHHKASMRAIEEDPGLNISDEDRPLVALLARYHRRAWPSLRHPRFAALPRKDRKALRRAAALLRVADGLDYTHSVRVKGCVAEIRPRKVVIRLDCVEDCPEERERAVKKGDLFSHVFRRKLECACQVG